MHVRVMFLTMLMIRDPDHVVRHPFRRIMKVANLSEEPEEAVRLARDAIKILESPDARSVDNQEFEGRRIRQVEDGWLILNGEKYEEERRSLAARIRKTAKQKERREMAKRSHGSGPLPGEEAFARAVANGDERGADALVTEALPERKNVHNQQSGSGGAVQGPSGVSGEGESGMAEAVGGAPEGSPGAGGAAGADEASGTEPEPEEEEATMTLAELARMAKNRGPFPEV